MDDDLLTAAKALLECIDNITTEEFAQGGERAEREALRKAITAVETLLAAARCPVFKTITGNTP